MDTLLTTLFSKPHISGKNPVNVTLPLKTALMMQIDRVSTVVRDMKLNSAEIALLDLKTTDLVVSGLSVANNANGKIEILPLPNSSYTFLSEQRIEKAVRTPKLHQACLRVTEHSFFVCAWAEDKSAFYLSEPLTLEDLQRASEELDQRRADRMEAEDEDMTDPAELYILNGPDLPPTVITKRDFA